MKSTFNFGEITLDFLKQFHDVQYDLHCEMEMNIVEVKARVIGYQILQKSYWDFRISQTKHYYSIFKMIEKKYESKLYDKINFVVLQQSNLHKAQRKIPSLDQIIKFCLNTTNADIIDCLTFSTLPSYFHYFSTTFNNSQLFNFFDGLKNSDKVIKYRNSDYTIFDLCARSLFITPYFLNFAQNVFQPVLSFYLSKDVKDINIDRLSETLKKFWKQQISFLPKFINKILLLSKNPAKTLSSSFFEIALSNSNESDPFFQIYCLSYSFQIANSQFLQVVSSLLTYQSETNILNDLIQIMIDNNTNSTQASSESKSGFLFSLDQYYFSEVDQTNAPPLFQPFLFSTLDFSLLDCILGIDKTFRMPSNITFFNCFQENEAVAESIHNEDEKTMVNDGFQVNAALRHLLQMSDMLPIFETVPEDLTIRNFFIDYLVRRGPIETLTKRIELFQSIAMKCSLDNPDLILYHLSQTKLQRTKEIRAMSAFTALSDKIRELTKAIFQVVSQIQKCYDSYILVDPILPSISSNSYTQYYESPILLIRDTNDILKIVGNPSPYTKEIIYSHLTRSFNLVEYSSSKHLNEKDLIVENYLKTNIKSFTVDSFVIKHQLPEFDKNRWLIEQLNILTADPNLNAMAHDANSESFLPRKAYLFNLIIGYIRNYLLTSFPPSEGEMGQDEYLTFEIAFFTSIIPNRIVTNASYLEDFLYNAYYNSIVNITEILCVLKLIIGKADLQP